MTDHSQRSVGHVIMVLGAVFVWGTLAKVPPVSVLNLKREREKIRKPGFARKYCFN